jgi:hypothetical protein
MAPATDVDAFLAELRHPLKPGVERLRAAILASDDRISEHVKWNAPSFRFAGEDRVTFRLQPGDRLQLVLHRGVRKRDDVAEFRFADPSGRVEWAAPDRGVLTFRDLEDVEARTPEVVRLVGRWLAA